MFMGLTVKHFLFVACMAMPTPSLAQTSTSRLCQQLATHTSADDVAYQAGADVKGRYVAPADLPESQNTQSYLPKTYNVLITVDQAARLNLSPNIPYKAEAVVAAVQVQPNGTLSINGQTLNSQQQQVLCGP